MRADAWAFFLDPEYPATLPVRVLTIPHLRPRFRAAYGIAKTLDRETRVAPWRQLYRIVSRSAEPSGREGWAVREILVPIIKPRRLDE